MLTGSLLLATVDWSGLLMPDQSLVESFVRGSIVYLALLVVFRVMPSRQHGSIGLPDVLLVVLVSECVSASLSAEAKSVPNGLMAVLALLFWSYVIDRLSYRWPWLHRRLEPAPLPLIRDGKPIEKNLRSEGISEDELLGQLRLNGVPSFEKVDAAFLEPEGEVSVIRKEDASPPSGEQTGKFVPQPSETDSKDEGNFDRVVDRFLECAAELRRAVAQHDDIAAHHRARAKQLRQLLARHGVRTRAGAGSSPPDKLSAPDRATRNGNHDVLEKREPRAGD